VARERRNESGEKEGTLGGEENKDGCSELQQEKGNEEPALEADASIAAQDVIRRWGVSSSRAKKKE